MKKEYIYPVMSVVAIDNIFLLSGSPDPQSSDANPFYPVLTRDDFELDWLDERLDL